MSNPNALSRLLLALLIVLLLTTTGCARMKGMFKDEDTNEGVAVETLYDKGHDLMIGGNWSGALETYRRLIAQYPYGPYSEQAMMETAYAQFKMGNNDDAISSIDRFLRTYPTHRNTAYLYYLRGLVNSNRDTVIMSRVFDLDASHRDLSAPMQAFNDFGIVVQRYAGSRYAADAALRMQALRNLFARHELETSLYYMRRGAYVAAANRAKHLLETYPQTRYEHDAVAALAEAYTRLGNDTLAADAKRVLETNAPDHPWLRGDWPDYPSRLHGLNPFGGDKSAVKTDD